jgi:hypothetical protein
MVETMPSLNATKNATSPTLKKLTLKKETLRQLASPELQLAVGGHRTPTTPTALATCCG